MTGPASEGDMLIHSHSHSPCHGKESQRSWPPPVLCRLLSKGSLNEVCWRLKDEKKQTDLCRTPPAPAPMKNARGLSRTICDAVSSFFGFSGAPSWVGAGMGSEKSSFASVHMKIHNDKSDGTTKERSQVAIWMSSSTLWHRLKTPFQK